MKETEERENKEEKKGNESVERKRGQEMDND